MKCYNLQYSLQAELEAWQDEGSGWDDEVDENEISAATDTMLKENRRLEREKRAREQKQKRQEKEMMRASRKDSGQIGFRIS